MVCSVDELASAAGAELLAAGGNAVDAAIATSAALAVTTPHMCGMGGDLFALVHQGTGAPAVLNASGRAGSGADPDAARSEGHREMPFRGDVRSAPVPGLRRRVGDAARSVRPAAARPTCSLRRGAWPTTAFPLHRSSRS